MNKPQWSFILPSVRAEKQSAITPPLPSPGHQAWSHLRDGISPSLRSNSLHNARWKSLISQTTGQSCKKNNNLSLILFCIRDIQDIQAIYPSGHQKTVFYFCLMLSCFTCPTPGHVAWCPNSGYFFPHFQSKWLPFKLNVSFILIKA